MNFLPLLLTFSLVFLLVFSLLFSLVFSLVRKCRCILFEATNKDMTHQRFWQDSWGSWMSPKICPINSDKMTGSLSVILTTPETSPMWLWPVKMMSAAMRSDDPALVTKCLDFCQALTNMGQTFNISLSIGSSFSFSLDTRRTTSHEAVTRKKIFS